MLTTEPKPRPVLVRNLPFLFTFEQGRPGGCRCVCGLYHGGEIPDLDAFDVFTPACDRAAQPGLLLQVVTDYREAGPLPVCAQCYAELLPLTASRP